MADMLEQNKPLIKQYLKQNKWTKADMTGEWQTDKYGEHVYGKMTSNYLINTKGVKIYSNGKVRIAHFNQYGGFNRPNIWCDEDGFGIYE